VVQIVQHWFSQTDTITPGKSIDCHMYLELILITFLIQIIQVFE